jgi:hypothetical protein
VTDSAIPDELVEHFPALRLRTTPAVLLDARGWRRRGELWLPPLRHRRRYRDACHTTTEALQAERAADIARAETEREFLLAIERQVAAGVLYPMEQLPHDWIIEADQ